MYWFVLGKPGDRKQTKRKVSDTHGLDAYY